MRVREFRDLLAELIAADAGGPVRQIAKHEPDTMANHSILSAWFNDGGEGHLMVYRMTGTGVPNHPPYKLPGEAW